MKKFLPHGLFFRLATFSPWAYTAGYVLVILAFAVIYYSFSSEFYHPYVKHEPSVAALESQVCANLAASFEDAFGKAPALKEAVRVDPKDVGISFVKPEGHFLVFTLLIKAIWEHEGASSEWYIPIPLRFDTRNILYTRPPMGEDSFFLFPKLMIPTEDDPFRQLAQFREDATVLQHNLARAVNRIQVSRGDIERIKALTRGHEGFPHKVPESFSRMFYLSLVTITTLGYGDIVPLTERTRWLTGAEATLGVILLGLFIGSVVRSGEPRETPIMTDREYSQDWKQMRIFASNQHDNLWYPLLLETVVRPVTSAYPDQEFFFSRYATPYGRDDGDADFTEFPKHQFDYTFQDGIGHRSIRLRFRGNSDFESRLKAILNSKPDDYWYSDIRSFAFEGDVGGPRFAPDRDRSCVLRRARLVSTLLCANSRLILDALSQNGELFRFEKNEDDENQPLKSTFQSVGHMLGQAWVDHDGNNLPIFIFFQNNLFRFS